MVHAPRVLITGGSGFIGTNLVEHFHQDGWETYNFDVAPPRNAAHHRFWKQIDILDRSRLVREVRELGPSVVLHFAARTDLRERRNLGGYAANIDGVCNVIDAVREAASVERLVVASSQLVCPPGYVPRDDYDYRPTTPYGQSKVLTERIVRLAGGTPTWTIVRPTSVWGPWFGAPFRNLFRLIARNSYIHPAGLTAWKAWNFVGNTVFEIQQILDAPPHKVAGKTLYLSDYEPTELSAFVERVRCALGSKPMRTMPDPVLRAVALAGDVATRLGWRDPPLSTFRYRNFIGNEAVDTDPIREIAGPLPFSVDDGIELTAGWLRGERSRL